MMQLLLLVLVVLMVLTVLAVKALGWPGLVIMILVIVVAAKLAVRKVKKSFQSMLTAPFAIKGAVLKNATVRVHGVTSASRPASTREIVVNPDNALANEDDDDEDDFDAEDDPDDADRAWYHVDVTITPGAIEGPMHAWEPGELVLAPFDAKGGNVGGLDDLDELGVVRSVEIWTDEAWQPDEGLKYEGPQRIRLLVGVMPDTKKAKLRYYLEVFGDLSFNPGLLGNDVLAPGPLQ